MIGPDQMALIHKAAFAQSRPWTAKEFAALLATKPVFVHGDERAFVLGRTVADEAELLTIATHPQHQRCGLARALLAQWAKAATSQGAVRGFLEVAADNEPARTLYESAGFMTVGRRSAYYPRPHGKAADGLIMQCALTLG